MRTRGAHARAPRVALLAALLGALLLRAARAHATAEVVLEVNPQNASVGEPVTIRYVVRSSMDQQGEVMQLDLGGLQVNGQAQQESTMVEMGRRGPQIMRTFEAQYMVRAPGPGRYVIRNARLVDAFTGRVIAQHPDVTVVVGGGGGVAPGMSSPGVTPGAQPAPGQTLTPADPDVPPLGDLTGADYNPTAFLRIAVDNPHPYLGQQIILRAWLYVASREAGCDITREPGMTGFWSESLRPLSQECAMRWFPQNVGGQFMSVGLVRKIALFPSQVGELTVGAMTASVDMVSGGIFRSVQRVEAHSPTITVDVREPPAAGRPAGYVPGTTGPLTLAAEVDRNELAVGETATVTVRAQSDGSLASASIAPPAHIDGVRIEPGVARSVHDTGGGGVTSTFTSQILVVPERPGRFDLGEVELAYWDPVAERYGVARARVPAITATGTALAAEHVEQRPDPAMELRALNPAPELQPYRPTIPRGPLALWILGAPPLALALGSLATALGRRAARGARARAEDRKQDPRAMLEEARGLAGRDARQAVSIAGRALDRGLAAARAEHGQDLAALPEHAREAVQRALSVSESVRFAGEQADPREMLDAVGRALDALEAEA